MIIILKIIGIVIAVIFMLFILLAVYSCCVMAGRTSEIEEKLYKEHKASSLSDLEKQVVDRVMEYHKSKEVN